MNSRVIMKGGAILATVAMGSFLYGCGSSPASSTGKTSDNGSNGKKTVITYEVSNYNPKSPQEKVFNQLIQKYEKLHPDVQIKLIVNSTNTDTQQSWLITQATAHKVPDIVWEQYNEVDSGVLPQGLLMDLTPYLQEPNPYVKGNKHWIDLWQSSAIPYMKNASGKIYLTVGSAVATGIFYNKADFQKAGITSDPTTFQEWVDDMKKLKAKGITPFLFADGGNNHCNTSWYERKFMSELLHSDLSTLDPNHSQVVSGKPVAIGIHKGIISMSNPAYAEGWKLLGSLKPYLASGGSTYDVCAQPTASSPPLNPEKLVGEGKVAMEWGATWYVYQLNQLGYKGKYGFFSFPEITTATTKYSSNISVTGTVGGPNGTGEMAVPTQKADSAMTPEHLKHVINFMQFMLAPQNFGPWNNNSSSNTLIPLIKGSIGPSGVTGLTKLLPKGMAPPTIDGIMDAGLTGTASQHGNNLVQAYLGGSLSWNKFSSEFEKVLQDGANTWAKNNNVNLNNS